MVDLGTGTSFDVSSYPGYQNFTADNFMIVFPSGGSASTSGGGCKGYDATGTFSVTKTYNNSTGILQGYGTITTSLGCANTRAQTISTNAYLTY
ncbi:hypothetical protein IJG91_00580 [Candidatus Saccharibacteria bacterium]|nr:hypothetical protein [Candidatus Saccharibacteria bacterium]